MAKYIVQGEEGADVDIVGTIFKPGDEVELREDVAAPLLEEGKIVVPSEAPADAPADETASTDAPAGEQGEDAPAGDEPAADAPSADAPAADDAAPSTEGDAPQAE